MATTPEIRSLYQLSQQLKEVIAGSFSAPLWVRAEVAEFRENKNGHCYLDLVEKAGDSDQIVARVKAIIWSYTYRMLKPYFETATGRSLSGGLKVLVQVSVEYQEVYGLSLIIRDIDPTYTLGDLEQKKREVLQQLRTEGVFDMNRELPIPPVIQHIAIISSPTAAGYGDFVNQLEGNGPGIHFYHHLFPAIMQGDQASESVASAFDAIYNHAGFFDVVVIIRGGGASLDLRCFDDYWLAYNITQFPLPVLTGIGHERDQSVADLVAHTALKTPTAVAGFIVDRAIRFLERVNDHADTLVELVQSELAAQNQRLNGLMGGFGPRVKLVLQQKKHNLEGSGQKIPNILRLLVTNRKNTLHALMASLKQRQQHAIVSRKGNLAEKHKQLLYLSHAVLKHQKQRLSFFEKSNRLSDPVEVLKRGYTLTFYNGNVVKDGSVLESGSQIETRFRDINVTSIVSGEEQNGK